MKNTMTSIEIAREISFEIEEGISQEFGNKQWFSKEYVEKCIDEWTNTLGWSKGLEWNKEVTIEDIKNLKQKLDILEQQ